METTRTEITKEIELKSGQKIGVVGHHKSPSDFMFTIRTDNQRLPEIMIYTKTSGAIEISHSSGKHDSAKLSDLLEVLNWVQSHMSIFTYDPEALNK